MRNLIIVSILALSATLVLADTIHVPGDQPTIQAGVNAAMPGDLVLVACGTYYENTIILRPGIILQGETGEADCVTIDAQEISTGLVATNLGLQVTLRGLTVINAQGSEGGGVQLTNSTMLVEQCKFLFNGARVGGGIKAESGATLTVRDCEFHYNNGNNAGGGILGEGGSKVLVEDTLFHFNTGTGGAGICVWFESSLTARRCRFVDNYSPVSLLSFGGGIVSSECYNAPMVVEDCVFTGNHAYKGGGFASNGLDTTISGCTFYGNLSENASGLWLEHCDAVIDNCIIAFGDSPSNGGFDSSPALSCTDVFGNTGGDWVFQFYGQDEMNGNLTVDPLFCLDQNQDEPLTLQSISPCAPASNPDCGLIGALPVGCGSTTIQETSWSSLKSLY